MTRTYRFSIIRADGHRLLAPRAVRLPGTRPSPSNHHAASRPTLPQAVRLAIGRARLGLLRRQKTDGSWTSTVEVRARFESDAILLLTLVGHGDDRRIPALAHEVLRQRTPGGAWTTNPDDAIDLSVSVRAYAALKLAGHKAFDRHMVEAREAILRHGSVAATDIVTRCFLAMLGQIPFADRKTVRLPRDPWAEALQLPLEVIASRRPVCPIPTERGIGELLMETPSLAAATPSAVRTLAPPSAGLAPRMGRLVPWHATGRIAAWRRALVAMVEPPSDEHETPFPVLAWTWMALQSLGLPDNAPALAAVRRRTLARVDAEPTTNMARVAPIRRSFSSTHLAIRGLLAGGMGVNDRPLAQGIAWLAAHESRTLDLPSTTAVSVPADPSHRVASAARTPSSDRLASLLEVLRDASSEPPIQRRCLPPILRLVEPEAKAESATDDARPTDAPVDISPDAHARAFRRAVELLFDTQNHDGGWGVLPDLSAACRTMSSPDATGRVLSALASCGYDQAHPRVARAADYLVRTQRARGAWRGRWDVGCLHGTWLALAGLVAVGVESTESPIQRAAAWIIARQRRDGGWSEPLHGEAESLVAAPSTPSQTAWAVLALIEAAQADHVAVERGVRFLIQSQNPGGGWRDPLPTTVVVPGVCYARDPMYAAAYPLIALSKYAVSSTAGSLEVAPAWRVVFDDEMCDVAPQPLDLLTFPRRAAFGS